MAKSPFPGMDPYLERGWLDLHLRLATYLCDQIQEHLPPDLCAHLQERVILTDELGFALRSRHPDVRVTEGGKQADQSAVAVELATAAPTRIIVDAASDPITEPFIEIVDARTQARVVTCIELISPTNKLPGYGRDSYVEKQAECRAASVNLVEIDLTRAGDRSAIFPWFAALEPAPTYVAAVRRAPRFERVEIHEFPLDRPLKPLAVPLRPTDSDVILALQPLVDESYRRGRYASVIDYSLPLVPPLTGVDAEFAERVLKKAGMQ